MLKRVQFLLFKLPFKCENIVSFRGLRPLTRGVTPGPHWGGYAPMQTPYRLVLPHSPPPPTNTGSAPAYHLSECLHKAHELLHDWWANCCHFDICSVRFIIDLLNCVKHKPEPLPCSVHMQRNTRSSDTVLSVCFSVKLIDHSCIMLLTLE